MPIYSIRCCDCGHRDIILRKVDERDMHIPACICCGSEMERIVDAPYVAPDIQPYQAVAVDVATGKPPVIGSRRQHREFLRRNGYVEVGNDVGGLNPKAGDPRGDFNLRGDLTKATREVLGRAK